MNDKDLKQGISPEEDKIVYPPDFDHPGDGRIPASPETYSIRAGTDSHITNLTEAIMHIEFHHYHDKVTVCLIHMRNGFIAKGTAGVVDPANFVRGVGEKVAKERAMNELWLVMGYQLQTELAQARILAQI